MRLEQKCWGSKVVAVSKKWYKSLLMASHAGNTGSNPVGDANKIKDLGHAWVLFCLPCANQCAN